MTDVAITHDGETFRGAWRLSGGDLGVDRGLESAVIVSLFSDARARPDDRLPDGETDPRGWWGQSYWVLPAQTFGSRLWLLWREKQTDETARRAEDFAREALAWMLAEDVAQAVAVSAEWIGPGVLSLVVAIDRPDGRTFERRYDLTWDGQFREPVNAA